jgi:hypothetical protein
LPIFDCRFLIYSVLGFNTPQLAAICHSGESRNPEGKLDAGSVIPDLDPGPA